jgi:endonuclease/exonuclease/phosphatase family metal-dependent hydrolase
MWRRTLLFMLFSNSLLSGDEPQRTAALRVLTYNVRFASDEAPNRWADRRPVARAMLNELRVDVIGMQEALDRQVKNFAADLPEFRWIGIGRDVGGDGEFMAVFYRLARLTAVEHGHFWLSNTPDVPGSSSWGNACNRMVTWVRFRDKSADREFYFFNTHLDHRSQLSRDKSAELIVKRTSDLTAGVPVVLVGDFNSADTTSSVYRTLLSGGFADTWTQASQPGSEANTFHGYQPTPGGNDRIDWILTRGPVHAELARIVDFSLSGQYPSDHHPVLATLRFADEPAH